MIKKILLAISIWVISLGSSCNSDNCDDGRTLGYAHSIHSYIVLGDGMEIRGYDQVQANTNPLEVHYMMYQIPFVGGTGSGISASFSSCAAYQVPVLSGIVNPTTQKLFIPSATLVSQSISYPSLVGDGNVTYSSASADTNKQYQDIAREIGDTLQRRLAISSYCGGSIVTYVDNLGIGALYNTLDSIQIVCTNKIINGRSAGSSLADICTFYAQRYVKTAMGGYAFSVDGSLASRTGYSPDMNGIFLSDFNKKRGVKLMNGAVALLKGRGLARYKDIIAKNCLQHSGVLGVNFPYFLPWKFVFPSVQEVGDYTFKITLYLDGGALRLESNEFTVTMTNP